MYTNNPHNYIYVQTDGLSYTSFVNVVKDVCIISSAKYNRPINDTWKDCHFINCIYYIEIE